MRTLFYMCGRRRPANACPFSQFLEHLVQIVLHLCTEDRQLQVGLLNLSGIPFCYDTKKQESPPTWRGFLKMLYVRVGLFVFLENEG